MKKKVLDSFVSIGSFNKLINNIFLLSEENTSSYVCVCNVHMLVEAQQNHDFNELLNNADIVTPDGMPIAKFLSWKYKINQERISGMDMLPTLIKECAIRNKSIYFYGSTNEVLENIKKNTKKDFFKLKTKFYSPPFRELIKEETQEIIHDINNFNPDFVFVALGCPKQEKWMTQHKGKINSCMIGLGGAFSVYAGLQKRAPKWMSNNSLEWLYRLLLEPNRLFRRYFFTNSLFIWYICQYIFKRNNK